MYIERIQLKNIRCFTEIEIRLDLSGDDAPWVLILGDNATGKTALLRSIAMGMCDESSAAGLMKEAEAGYIRRGQESAHIEIELRGDKKGSPKYLIKTTIEKMVSAGGAVYERLRQRTIPAKSFPWREIFVSAYGAGRGTVGTGDIAGYSPINAVYNMFNYGEGLQNPELTIRRVKELPSQHEVIRTLNELMQTEQIQLTDSGVVVDGKWGREMPLRDLADGYKSTFLWIADFLGWALSHNPRLTSSKEIRGILLIDEIEQHLHATWQRRLVHQLREHFPKVQFFSTSHSPLIASSVGQMSLDSTSAIDKLLLLELEPGGSVSSAPLPHMRGLRVDQVLASRAFKYLIEADPQTETILAEASRLAGLGSKRTKSEEQRYKTLKAQIAQLNFSERTTQVEREIEDEWFQKAKMQIKRFEAQLPEVAGESEGETLKELTKQLEATTTQMLKAEGETLEELTKRLEATTAQMLKGYRKKLGKDLTSSFREQDVDEPR